MNVIEKLSQAEKWLAEAKSLDDLKQIHDIALAAEAYAQAHRLGIDAENHAREVRLVAGLRIAQLKPAAPPEKRDQGRGRKKTSNHTELDLKISKKKMAEFRKLDKTMNEPELRERCREIANNQEKISITKLLRGDWYQMSADER